MNAAPDPTEASFAFASFLATAARGCLEEGVFVASFRLIDAILKYVEMNPALREDPFFASLMPILETRFRRAYFMEESEYKALLDEIIVLFAHRIREQEGLSKVS
jgi:hypothetical protein